MPVLRNRLETLVRSRIARICLAALINAELIRIPAPINGQLTQELPHKGDLVDSSNKIKLIQSITIDRSRLVSIP